MTDESPTICNFFLGTLLGLCLVFMTPYIFIPAGQWGRFNQFTCHVDRIVYPVSPPSHDNMTGWGECDCGKRCSSWNPCIDIYTNISDSVPATLEFYEINVDCTFHDDECPDGEDARNLELYLNQSREVFEKYNNKTMECFYNDDGKLEYIFLVKEWDWDLTIGFLVVFAMLLWCLGCINWEYYRKIREQKRLNKHDLEMKIISKEVYPV